MPRRREREKHVHAPDKRMIDIHCHILPDVDDGASGLEQSLEMARIAQADGIDMIVATPHAFNGLYVNAVRTILDQCERLNEALERASIEIELLSGAEVHFCPGMASKVRQGAIQTINGSGRYILLEFPLHAMPPHYKDDIFELKLADVTPIIAHPERNAFFNFHPEALLELVEMGCLVQITAASILGGMGRGPAESARKMLKTRMAHIIASDAHSPDKRPPVLSPAVDAAAKILGSREEALRMVLDRPSAILRGETVEVPPPATWPKKRWFSFLGIGG